MKKIVVILLLLIAQKSFAQNYFGGGEFGVSGGFANYFGDLNEEYGVHYVRPSFGCFFRRHLNPYISVRANFLLGHIGYKDEYNKNIYYKTRNLSFESNLVETSVQAEFNFFKFSTGDFEHRWTPFLTCGIGIFYYDPYAQLNGKNYQLRPFGTEGQFAGFDQRKYGKVAVCLPVGMGFKYWLRPGLNFGLEVVDRMTTTDYLDDVSGTYIGSNFFPTDPLNPNPASILQDPSILINPNNPLGRPGKQRGNSATKDQYMMVLFHLSFQVKVYKCPTYMNGDLLAY